MLRRIIPKTGRRGEEGNSDREATSMLLLAILKGPNVRIYQNQDIIHLTKGV